MIVALPQQPRLLAGNLIELHQHTLDSNIAAIPFPGKHNSTIASRAQLLSLIDLETPHLEDVARNLVAISRHGDDIGLKLGLTDERLGLINNLLDRLLWRIVIAGLRRLPFALVGLFVLGATPAASRMRFFLFGWLAISGGIGSLRFRLGDLRGFGKGHNR